MNSFKFTDVDDAIKKLQDLKKENRKGRSYISCFTDDMTLYTDKTRLYQETITTDKI